MSYTVLAIQDKVNKHLCSNQTEVLVQKILLHLSLLSLTLHLSHPAVPISNVTMLAKATNLVEFNDTAVLMCSAVGSFPSYVWMNGSSVVTGGQVQLSNGYSTLTIVSVTRYDLGPFRCNVSNGVSSTGSQPVSLSISCEFELKKWFNYCPTCSKSQILKSFSFSLYHQMAQVTRR